MGAGPKYNNPEVDVTGLGKSFIIYNADALEIYRTVIFVRVQSMLKLWERMGLQPEVRPSADTR